jgi:hypothetical protein
LKTRLRNLGFEASLKDRCLFFKDDIALLVHVDDLINTVDLLNQAKANLARESEIKDLRRPKFILGVQIMEASSYRSEHIIKQLSKDLV